MESEITACLFLYFCLRGGRVRERQSGSGSDWPCHLDYSISSVRERDDSCGGMTFDTSIVALRAAH